MKKIVISLSIILAFAMFNSSAKADAPCDLTWDQGALWSECTCENYECSGYRWYYPHYLCGQGSCPCACENQRNDYPNIHVYLEGIEYECYTPRFGCDVGADCNEKNPYYSWIYTYNEACYCP